MSNSVPIDATANTDRFYTVIKSMNTFDRVEVNAIIQTLLSPTPRENCFLGTYYRSLANVESLLLMQKSKDYQAIAMLARALFELAVDIRLLEAIPNSWVKMLEYADLEKLRAAKRIVAFKAANPNADVDAASFSQFITRHSQRILGQQTSTWPQNRNPKHWSGIDRLGDRAAQLKEPFDQIYEVDYARLSWFTHPGLTGIVNVNAETFIHLCAYAFHIAATAYRETLLCIIREIKISKANDRIKDLLSLAIELPFTDTPEQAEILTKMRSAGR
jgi:Family of unknown function (DUF5677)